jgi:hypothetical protein
MKRNKEAIKKLREGWVPGKSFDYMLTFKQKATVLWWTLTNERRFLYFIMQMSIFGKHALAAFTAASTIKKEHITDGLVNMGYYHTH